MMAYVLVRLGKLCHNTSWLDLAQQTIGNAAAVMQRAPNGCGQMMLALDLLLNDTQEIVIAGTQTEEEEKLRHYLFDAFIPRRTIAFINADNPSATAVVLRQQIDNRPLVDNQTTVYLCQNFSCQKPLSNYGDIKSAFDTMKASVSR